MPRSSVGALKRGSDGAREPFTEPWRDGPFDRFAEHGSEGALQPCWSMRALWERWRGGKGAGDLAAREVGEEVDAELALRRPPLQPVYLRPRATVPFPSHNVAPQCHA